MEHQRYPQAYPLFLAQWYFGEVKAGRILWWDKEGPYVLLEAEDGSITEIEGVIMGLKESPCWVGDSLPDLRAKAIKYSARNTGRN